MVDFEFEQRLLGFDSVQSNGIKKEFGKAVSTEARFIYQ